MRWRAFEWACLGVIAAAVALRVVAILDPIVTWDGAWALVLARSLVTSGSFEVPWTGEPAGYWPPLFPIFLAPFVKVLGPGFQTLMVATTAAWALLVLATYLATRDLFGRSRALVAAALVAASPGFFLADSRGMSESLLAACIVLALWGFARAAKDARFLAFAVLGAALAYFAKASVGLAFAALLVTAFVGWRAWSLGWRALLARRVEVGLYAAALVALVPLALARGLGGVGLTLAHPVREAVLRPTFLPLLAFKFAFAAAFLLAVTLPFSLRVREAWAARRDPVEGALWVAVLAPLAVGAVFTTTFYLTEGRPLVDLDNARYLTPAIVPLLWLLLPRADLHAPEPPRAKQGEGLRTRHRVWYGLAVAGLAIVLLLNPAAAIETPARLAALLGLAAIPLAFAFLARSHSYKAETRRTGKEESTRLVRASVGDSGAALAGLAFALLATALFSYFFVAVGLALVVALSTASPRARATSMAILLVCVMAPRVTPSLPMDDVASALALDVPAGEIVGVQSAPYVYASAPLDARLIEAYGAAPGVRWYVTTDGRPLENATLVRTWEYAFVVTPTQRAELWLEERLAGDAPTVAHVPAAALWKLNTTG